jgi:hypothetical protein
MKNNSTEKKYFFDKPRNVKIFMGVFYVSVLLLIIIDFFIPKHPYFPWEHYPSFYGTYGLVGCIALVLGAKYILRKIVKREEKYYD